ncbi:hypothetical protein AB0E04_48530 [Streptomyces sp. NPDC048251]|uniref:effector-associated constant component EACC1 n=1 Tax=Streptomyces sp. NPDC048251 TaxID=3154501 RepID=UPI00343041D8
METGVGRTEELRISCKDGPDELRSLLDWLRHEDDLRGRVTLQHGDPEPGEMGSAHDTLAVLLGTGGAGTVLARSLFSWLSQRRSNVKITVETATGLKVELDAQQVTNVEALTRQVAALVDPEADSQ